VSSPQSSSHDGERPLRIAQMGHGSTTPMGLPFRIERLSTRPATCRHNEAIMRNADTCVIPSWPPIDIQETSSLSSPLSPHAREWVRVPDSRFSYQDPATDVLPYLKVHQSVHPLLRAGVVGGAGHRFLGRTRDDRLGLPPRRHTLEERQRRAEGGGRGELQPVWGRGGRGRVDIRQSSVPGGCGG
jgi:hypothetical protein